jgi:glycosyltransferase domain-containing protein
MNDKPLVSIGMPVHNEERFVRRALNSLLAQNYENSELIISDNASTDRTADICKEYTQQDTRVRYYRSDTNTGADSNFRRVLELARGKYFMWAAADDYWMPTFISTMIEELESSPDASVAMCAVERIQEDGGKVDLVHHGGSADPSKMSNFDLAMALAAGKPYHLYVYGVYRTDFLRQAFDGFPSVMAGDRLFVCQVALATKFRYVDEILHIRSLSNTPRAERYKHEALGRVWRDFWGPEKTGLAFGPYLWRSTVIPAYRKLWIPLLLFRYAISNFQHRWRSLATHFVYVIVRRFLSSKRRMAAKQFLRRLVSKSAKPVVGR